LAFRFSPSTLANIFKVFQQEEINLSALPANLYQVLITELIAVISRILPNSATRAMLLEAVRHAERQNQYRQLSRVMWFLYGHSLDDEALLDIFAEYAATPESQEKNMSNETLWGYYLSLLAIHNRIEDAKEHFALYRRLFQPETLYRLPPAAKLAYSQNWGKDVLADPVFVYETLLRNLQENSFEEFIKDKSVAVVGHGPQENGTGHGREIDAHDLVMRFHACAPHDPKVQADYGASTGILSISHLNREKKLKLPSSVKAIFLVLNLEQEKTWSYMAADTSILVKLLKEGNVIPSSTPREKFQQIGRLLDYTGYSAGLRTGVYLKSIKPELALGDFYGFSFKDPTIASYAELLGGGYFSEAHKGHYQKEAEKAGAPDVTYPENHPLQMEKALAEKVFMSESCSI
jgi:hypothetical protein